MNWLISWDDGPWVQVSGLSASEDAAREEVADLYQRRITRKSKLKLKKPQWMEYLDEQQKRGRPRSFDPKIVLLQIRVTLDQKYSLFEQATAKKLSLSDYVRTKLGLE